MKKVDKSFLFVTFILFITYGIYYLITGSGLPCMIRKITHLYCPGCGITRMLISLLHLDFYQAFRYNPLVFILLLNSIIYFIFNKIYSKLTNKKISIPNSVYIIILVLVLLFGIFRNIPLFSYLIPTQVN